MTCLTDLPPKVLDNLLWFLPQHSLLNLALTNFHFYEPCAKHLYKNIVIQIEPVLRSSVEITNRRRLDFIESSQTTICGFSSVATSKETHMKLVSAKIQTLVESIKVNPSLAQKILKISVIDAFGRDVLTALQLLFSTLQKVENSVEKIYISDYSNRLTLQYREWCGGFNLRSLVIDDLDQLSAENLAKFPYLHELIVAGVGQSRKLDVKSISGLEKVAHFHVREDVSVYNAFIEALMDLYERKPFQLNSAKTFNVVQTHGNYQQKVPFLNTLKLVNFQVSLGCEDHSSCDQECISEGLSRFEFQALKRLSILQSGKARQNSHKNTEKWDLVVFSFVKEVLESCDSLSYLSIRHNVPLDGLIDDGYEGNYLRKVQLYTIVLPRLLSTAQRHVVNLVLPNFVASLACYEQPMNTFLWNGCKCTHCAVYLGKLDEYILYHRYHSPEKQVFKDLQTVQMVRTMSEVLTDRMAYDPNLGDLHTLGQPMKNTTWNFHDCKFSVPFRCLPVKTYDINDMEDDAEESREGKERFFDAEDKPNDCVFLRKEQFFPNYSIVISHFLDDLIRKMINLNRGDAEDADINQVSYENDGWTNLQINKMLVNGIDYNFDHEINGTIFYTNSFDDAELD